jgi:hypothetical protein
MHMMQYVWRTGGLFPRKPPPSAAPAAVTPESAAELDRPSGAATLRRGGKANIQKSAWFPYHLEKQYGD